ncbi:MAG: phosphotransferase, partial [Candidatus Poribacteria bacterium]
THGDLGGRHILMDPERRVEGVIDFGKVCVGYRDRDFHPLLSNLGESFTRRILAAYRHPDPDRVIAAGCFYGAVDSVDALLRGLEEGVDWKIRDGRNGMANALRVYANVRGE